MGQIAEGWALHGSDNERRERSRRETEANRNKRVCVDVIRSPEHRGRSETDCFVWCAFFWFSFRFVSRLLFMALPRPSNTVESILSRCCRRTGAADGAVWGSPVFFHRVVSFFSVLFSIFSFLFSPFYFLFSSLFISFHFSATMTLYFVWVLITDHPVRPLQMGGCNLRA